MKNLKRSVALFLLAFLVFPAASMAGGYFDVYLKNNCSGTIEVSVRAEGSTSVSKYSAGDKVKVPAKAGYEVYVDGKLYLKLEDSHSGKEINLCK